MLTFWIALALIEWFFLSLAVFTYIRHSFPGISRARLTFWSLLWPLTVILWTVDFAFAKDLDFI